MPFLVHALWYQDVPIHLWLMVLPGVFAGAKVCPTNCHIALFVFNSVMWM